MHVPILMYHDLNLEASAISITPNQFAWQMGWLREHARQAGVAEFEYARVLVFEPREGPRFAAPPASDARVRRAS